MGFSSFLDPNIYKLKIEEAYSTENFKKGNYTVAIVFYLK